jgi:hypothetical protein
MRRREFLSSVLGGVAGGLPLATGADIGDPANATAEPHEQLAAMAAQYEQLSCHADGLLWQVQALTQELWKADGHRSQILSLVHDMRAPLAGIELATRFLLDNTRPAAADELSRHRDITARSCRWLAELINDVFALEQSLLNADAHGPVDAG